MAGASETGRSAPHLVALPTSGARLAAEKIELLLAEKRTALSLMRTGIAVLTLPLSILTVLIATSGYYHFGSVLHLAVPLLGLCGGLAALGILLLVRSLLHLRRLDQRIEEIKRKSGPFADAIL